MLLIDISKILFVSCFFFQCSDEFCSLITMKKGFSFKKLLFSKCLKYIAFTKSELLDVQ